MFTLGKQYDKEYREYVVKLIVEEGRKITDVAYELGLSASTLGKWVQKHRKEKLQSNQPQEYITPSEYEALKKAHKKELEKLQEENEILKKAMHIFTKNQE
ncbi:transposase [Oceanobacillus kapialis]|uniref:Transposase n=1 Tax=Oceanobacillus kapialis TaxID=481353 RepID=A0ABW5PZW7_9BACI